MEIDATGVALIITAITALIVAVGGLYMQLLTFRKDQRAQNEKLQTAVDGSLTKMLELIKKGAAAEAILENDRGRAVVQAAVDKAVGVEREKGRELAQGIAAAAPALGAPVEVEVVRGPGVQTPLIVKADQETKP